VTKTTLSTKEQRRDKRTPLSCAVFVHGITEDGERIKAHTMTDNISHGGLFLQLPQALKLGSVLFTFTQLHSGARLAARGKVVRVETKAYGFSGYAVCFRRPRLIPAI